MKLTSLPIAFLRGPSDERLVQVYVSPGPLNTRNKGRAIPTHGNDLRVVPCFRTTGRLAIYNDRVSQTQRQLSIQ